MAPMGKSCLTMLGVAAYMRPEYHFARVKLPLFSEDDRLQPLVHCKCCSLKVCGCWSYSSCKGMADFF